MISFSIHILEKLNGITDLFLPITDILEDIRSFFDFGAAFVYVADHTGLFSLSEHSVASGSDMLPNDIQLEQALGKSAMEKFATMDVVAIPIEDSPEITTDFLKSEFSIQSAILIPIKSETNQIIALVGLADRRGTHRHEQMLMRFAYSLLAAAANHIKLRLYQIRIASTQKSLESIMDHMGVDIYVNDFNTHEILYANQSMAAPYGGIEKLLGGKCWDVLYDDKTEQCSFCPQKKIIDENGEPTKIYSWDYQRPFDGSWFRVLSAAFRWVDGRLAHVVSSVDITENKQNEALVRQLAEYDTLTNLPNRRRLTDDIERHLAHERSEGQIGYLCFFDLDGFKKINDEIGHQAGDELLAGIGQYAQSEPLLAGRVYRHGGDEFVLQALDCDLGQVMQMIGTLLARFEKPWHTTHGEVLCKTSIGIACFPQEGDNPTDLLHNADLAMYAAKKAGAGQARFYDGGQFTLPQAYADKHA